MYSDRKSKSGICHNRFMADEKQRRSAQAVSWRAAEYELIHKNIVWYMIIGLIATILFVIALWQKNFFFAIFIFIAAAMVFVFARRRPNVLDFEIGENGVRAGTMQWSWDTFADFSVYSRPGRLDEIIFRKTTSFNPYIRIPADAQTASRVRAFLDNRLTEVAYEATTLEIITDWFGI